MWLPHDWYFYSRYHLKDVIVGKIYFLLVRIKIRHMELAIIKREIAGTGKRNHDYMKEAFYTVSAPHFLLGTIFSPKFWKGGRVSEKNECLGGLKEFLPQISGLGGRAYYVSCQKRLCKIKYGLEGSISNVDLGLIQPSNQLMFSFVAFWFC